MKFQVHFVGRIHPDLVRPIEQCSNTWSRVNVYSTWLECGASNLRKVCAMLDALRVEYYEPERIQTFRHPAQVWVLNEKITLPAHRVLAIMERAVEDGRTFAVRRARKYINRAWRAFERGRAIDEHLALLNMFIADPVPSTIFFPKGVRGPSAHVIYQEHFATGVTGAHRELIDLRHQFELETARLAQLDSKEAEG